MIEQLDILFRAMTKGCDVDTMAPLVRTALAVISHHPDIVADKVPLSSFNVLRVK